MAIDGDWRSQLRAELALGGGLERLTEAERVSIEEGRAFEAVFNGATTTCSHYRGGFQVGSAILDMCMVIKILGAGARP